MTLTKPKIDENWDPHLLFGWEIQDIRDQTDFRTFFSNEATLDDLSGPPPWSLAFCLDKYVVLGMNFLHSRTWNEVMVSKGLNAQEASSTSSASDLININTLELFYRFPVSSLFYWTYIFTINEADFSSLPQKDRPPREVTDPRKGLKEMFDLIKPIIHPIWKTPLFDLFLLYLVFFWNMICWIISDSFYLKATLPRFSYFIKQLTSLLTDWKTLSSFRVPSNHRRCAPKTVRQFEQVCCVVCRFQNID